MERRVKQLLNGVVSIVGKKCEELLNSSVLAMGKRRVRNYGMMVFRQWGKMLKGCR
jgi:hypothetical protein